MKIFGRLALFETKASTSPLLALLLLGFTLSLLSPAIVLASSAVERLEAKAEDLEANEDYLQAERIYRQLYFGTQDRKYARSLKKLGKKIAGQLVEIAQAEATTDEDRIRYLGRALEFSPRNSDAKKALKKAGYKLHEGEWRTKEEIQDFAKQDEAQQEKRLRELRLGDKFNAYRRGPFRFFTDVPGGNQQLKLMMRASQAVYNGYVEEMKAFDLRYPSEGLDVVIFTRQEDYVRTTRSDSTAGVYIPSLGSSFFYLAGNDNFATLLHELTHQFNDKVGYFGETHTCIEEGMAEYFGYAKLVRGMSQIQLGQIYSKHVIAIQGHALKRRNHDFRYTPFLNFLEIDGGVEYDFYQQAWAFYYYLMHSGDPRHRLAVYEYLTNTRNSSPRISSTLAGYGFKAAGLEKAFLDYWKDYK